MHHGGEPVSSFAVVRVSRSRCRFDGLIVLIETTRRSTVSNVRSSGLLSVYCRNDAGTVTTPSTRERRRDAASTAISNRSAKSGAR